MTDLDLLALIQSVTRVEARPLKHGYQVVAITESGEEHIVKKGGALRSHAHFYMCRANGNGHDGLSPYVQCATKPTGEQVKSMNIEVVA